MVAKNLRFHLLRFFQYRSALFTIGVLLLASCSGGGESPSPATSQNTVPPPVGGGIGPAISVARVTPNVQKFRVHENDLIWFDKDPFVGLKKASISGGSEIPLTIPMNEPLSLRVQGQDVYWIENRFVSNNATKLIVKASPDGTVSYIAQGRGCTSSENGAFVLDNENAYWIVCEASSNNSFIQKVPLNGDSPIILATISERVADLADDSSSIYWEQEGSFLSIPSIFKVSKTGGAPLLVFTGNLDEGFGRGMIVSGGQVFFSDTGQSFSYRIRKVPSTGGTATVLLGVNNLPFGDYVRGIATNGATVYWSDMTTINSIPVGGGALTILASSQNEANSIVLQGNSLFWVEGVCCATGQVGRIKRVPLAGGQVSVVIDDLLAPNGRLTANSATLYWIEGGALLASEGIGRIRKAPILGGTHTTVASGILSSQAPSVISGPFIYLGDHGAIKKLSLDGGLPEILYSIAIDQSDVGYINDIATDDAFLYWTESNYSTVRRMPLSGGVATTLSTLTSARAKRIAVANGFVYWVDDMSLAGDSIRKMPVAGGPLNTIASNIQGLTGLEVDSSSAYFAEYETGDIRKVSVNGGTVTTLFDGSAFDSPSSITQDQTHIYWSNQAQVARVSKNGGGFTFYELIVKNSGGGIAVDDTSVYFVRDEVILRASPK